jgi:hypothetical protein
MRDELHHARIRIGAFDIASPIRYRWRARGWAVGVAGTRPLQRAQPFVARNIALITVIQQRNDVA